MASKRKQKKVVRKPKATEKTLGESIIEQMVLVNHALTCIVGALADRNKMLAAVARPPMHTGKPVIVMDEITRAAVGGPPVSPSAPPASTVLDQAAEGEPPAAPKVTTGKKRGRPSKAELAARAAAADAEQTTIPETFVSGTAQFFKQCPCGVREDVPTHLHAKGCPVHFPGEPGKSEVEKPLNEVLAQHEKDKEVYAVVGSLQGRVNTGAAPPPPTLDDVRATAIGFVGKHGKEKLVTIIQKHGAGNLSAVPPANLPALLAELQAAG
jgi:hypothetical protein